LAYCFLFRSSVFFSRPTLLYTGLILFVLPRGLKFTPTAKSSPLVNAWVVLIAAFYLVSLLYFRFRNFPVDEAGITLTAVFTELKHMPHLGVMLALGYIALVYSKLLAPLRVEMRLFIWHRWLIAIVVFVTVNYLAGHVLARPSHADELYFLQRLVFSSGSWPLKFIIAHVAFFGPVILLMIIFWKRLSAAIIEAGVGLTAVFTLALFHGIDSESRHLIEYYVFIIALTAKACHAMDWKRWQLVGLAAVAFFIARLDAFPAGPVAGGSGQLLQVSRAVLLYDLGTVHVPRDVPPARRRGCRAPRRFLFRFSSSAGFRIGRELTVSTGRRFVLAQWYQRYRFNRSIPGQRRPVKCRGAHWARSLREKPNFGKSCLISAANRYRQPVDG